jgi:peptide/nickel transport system permease protein
MSAQNVPHALDVIPVRAVHSDSPGRLALRRLIRHRLAVPGLVVVAVMVILAILGDEARAYEQNLRSGFTNRAPDDQFLLGTDALGRDILSRLLVGGRISIVVALVSVALATLIGTAVGVAAGFFGGWVDNLLMRIVDIVLSFPAILLLLVVSALVGPGVLTLILIIAVVSWAPASRIVRGQILSLREATFVEAARVIGVSDWTMIRSHILPNIVAPLVVFATFGVATVIIFEASLSYLGLGVQQPTPSWGNMLNVARSITALERYPWQWVPPAAFIVLMVLSVNFVGDGLRDALDQRATSQR